jgi:hypothetical protein
MRTWFSFLHLPSQLSTVGYSLYAFHQDRRISEFPLDFFQVHNDTTALTVKTQIVGDDGTSKTKLKAFSTHNVSAPSYSSHQ